MTPIANRSGVTSQRVTSAPGGWYGGVPDWVSHRVADAGSDVEVQRLCSAAGEDYVERLDVSVHQAVLGQVPPLVVLVLEQGTLMTLGVEFSEAS